MSWKAAVSVEVSSDWTWLCAYKQRPTHPKSNYKMSQDHSMKLVSLTLFHPLFPLFVAQAFNLFSSLQEFFSRFAPKNKSCTCLNSPIVPRTWRHSGGSSLCLPQQWVFWKGWMGLPLGRKGRQEVEGVHDSDATITDWPFLVLALILPLMF